MHLADAERARGCRVFFGTQCAVVDAADPIGTNFLMRRDTWNDTQQAWFGSGFPLTIALIAANFLTMALFTFRVPLGAWLVFNEVAHLAQPWRLLTYPLVSFAPMAVLWNGIGLWFLGGSLERSWGTKYFAIFFFGLAIINALAMTLGAALLKLPVFVGLEGVLLSLLVAWGAINAGESINYFFVTIPVRVIVVIAFLFAFFNAAAVNPWLGFFALIGPTAGHFWVLNRSWSSSGFYSSAPLNNRPKLRLIPGGQPKQQRPLDDRFTWRDLNPFERIARKRREKKLQKLLGDD